MSALPPVGSPRVLFVIDLAGYVFRAYHAVAPLSSPSGEPTHATFGTLSMLTRLINERKPTLLAAAMDSKAPSFRREIDPNYKANRPPPPEDLSVQMTRCRELVEAFGIKVWQQEGIEADDIIASVVRIARQNGVPVVIVSGDKDLMQLVGDGVLMWDTMHNKVYGPAEVEAKFGVGPAVLRDLLALTGDSSDNVPGVPSVGPKTATKLLSEFGDLNNLYANLDKVSHTRLRETLQRHRDAAYLSLNLVTLRDGIGVAFDEAELAFETRANRPALRQLYRQLGFTRQLESLGEEEPSAGAAGPIATEYTTVLTEDQLRQMVEQCRRSSVFALDTETTSTNAMLARLVGLSVSPAEGEAYYVPLTHDRLGGPKQLPLSVVRDALAPLLSVATPAKVGHNLKYDEIVLRRHGFPPLQGVRCDTMIASYLIDPESTHGLKDVAERELGIAMTTFEEVTSKGRGADADFASVEVGKASEYACADADMTLRLGMKLGPKIDTLGLRSLQDDIELPLSLVLTEMEMHGVLVDASHLGRLGRSLESQMMMLEGRAKDEAGRDFNVNSPRQLETILFDKLKLRVVKKTKTGRSTDASVLEALADDHALVGTILELRQLAKLKGTYIDALPKLVHPETKRIHTRFNQTVAATGRLSSSDPNLQNIPIRTELGRAIRAAFIAPPGYLIVSADYSQIELRVLAHLSGDRMLVEAFQTADDVHVRTAMELFGVERSAVTEGQRRQAKTINFGVIYGMGEVSLGKRLGIDRGEAAQFIARYFERYEGVRKFMESTLSEAREHGMVKTLLGRPRYLPDLRSPNGQLRAQAERVAGNTPIQGTAADILKVAMVKLREPVVQGARMVLTVHDELVFEVPEQAVEEATARIREAMEHAVKLSVPLVVDARAGKTWAEAH